ncbi:HAD family hydrolase [Bacillus luteolus]|uniref:HAD family hydrolase n=1 Tax=Litchfieldia luteola TaxID=682179 RepID=A0ABR9QPV6_9BACI|nr:HAD family hydrolase [Cytobacillus luteolus]MBE4910537.1 HAD family hydrolase [Cytobacillus luteolus]MBP1943714.1 putative hydrolase of the HAD superfamily [Cytobacillus luteolus]
MIKAVLFDLDGTLLNRDASVAQFIQNQYERLVDSVGHIPKEEYIARFIELDARGYVWKDTVYQQIVKEYKITKFHWEDLLKDYIEEFKHSCVPFPNLIRMLDELKGKSLKLGIITNGQGKFQMDNIKALGIEEYFDIILVSEWEGLKKPDKRIFEKALHRLNLSASEAMFIGDHPENDVKASMQMGMVGVWKRDAQWSMVEADYIVNDLIEIVDLVI